MANIETLAADTRYFAEVAAPGTPSAGQAVLYVKTDGKVYIKNDAGTETDLTASGGASPTFSAYTPTLTAASVNPNIGTTGTATGRYSQTGKVVMASGTIVFGGTGISAGTGDYFIALPVASAASLGSNTLGTAVLYDSSATRFFVCASYWSTTTLMRIAIGEAAGQIIADHDSPFAWATGDQLIFNLWYEAA